ncbi:interaptin-like [Physella acuta]|uniref:interaptin-like n=1 Tax=Physella acuta TaxID=109671 RepID=UPI0027DD9536|nr:interaptin-like [Physella acuta]XP_059176520.1 interaptin-like [Physella acuta]XP_059176522.1 interaptin-like [Physella acuta]
MAQTNPMLSIIQAKLDFIAEEKSRLKAGIDSYVNIYTSEATAAVENGSSAEGTRQHLIDVNSRLDLTLQLILKTIEAFRYVEAAEQQSDQSTTFFSSYSKIYDQRLESLEVSTSFQDEVNQNTTKQMASIEERFHALESEIQTLKVKNLELEESHVTFSSKTTNHISELDERTNQIKDRQESLHEQQKLAEIDFANTFVTKSDFSEHTEWVKRTNQTLEALSTKVTHNTVDLNDVTNTCKDLGETTKELVSKVETVQGTMQDLKLANSTEMNKLREMKKLLAANEKSKKETMDYFKARMEQGETLNKNIYKLIASRLEPLNRLQEIFNKHKQQQPSRVDGLNSKVVELKYRADDFSSRINEMSARINALSSQFSICSSQIFDLQVKCEDDVIKEEIEEDQLSNNNDEINQVGFTAYLKSTLNVDSNTQLGDLLDELTEDTGFTASSGLFVAPVEGLYLFFLSLKQVGSGRIRAHVKTLNYEDSDVYVVCKAMTNEDGTTSCGLGVSYMNAGDTATVKIVHVDGEPQLSPYTSFSGCLISRS